jgi:hypothetical protein
VLVKQGFYIEALPFGRVVAPISESDMWDTRGPHTVEIVDRTVARTPRFDRTIMKIPDPRWLWMIGMSGRRRGAHAKHRVTALSR